MSIKKRKININILFRKLDYLDFKPSKFKEKLLLLSDFKKGWFLPLNPKFSMQIHYF